MFDINNENIKMILRENEIAAATHQTLEYGCLLTYDVFRVNNGFNLLPSLGAVRVLPRWDRQEEGAREHEGRGCGGQGGPPDPSSGGGGGGAAAGHGEAPRGPNLRETLVGCGGQDEDTRSHGGGKL